MPCDWSNGKECQFANLHHLKLIEYAGSTYCPYHLPLDAPQKAASPDHQAIIGERADLCGVQFPSRTYTFQNRNANSVTLMNDCHFAPGVVLQLFLGTYEIRRARFHGEVKFENRGRNKVLLTGSRFVGPLQIQALVQPSISRDWTAANWEIDSVDFEEVVDLSSATFGESLRLSDTTFAAPVEFEGCKLPQQTVAHDVRFVDRAIDQDSEGSYRYARLALAEHRNRDLEGVLYAAEKRSQRRGMKWWWPSLWVSTVYDVASRYGQDYVRALVVFLGIQVAAYVGYGAYFQRWDSSVVVFTFAQLVKPFELFSVRTATATSGMSDLFAFSAPGPALLFGSALHSILSLSMVAIFLLAVRWRFRRE